MRVGAGLATAGFVLAITFGASAREQGWSVPAAILASVLIFSGSAQFALLAALAGGGAGGPAVAAALLINGRFLPMGLAVAPSLSGGRFRRAVQGQAVWVPAGIALVGATAGALVGLRFRKEPTEVRR